MMISLHETCLEYLKRRLSEGWKCISLEGYNAVLLSPEGIRRDLDLRNDIETLRPSADGTTNDWWPKSAGDHYVEVDEVVPDELGSYVIRTATGFAYDLYNLPASSGSGTITSVSVKTRFKHGQPDYMWNGYAYAVVRTHDTNYTLVINDIDTYFITFTKTWVNNPNTSSPWTWDEIDALEIGIWGQGNGTYSLYCTQVYVEVNYTPPVVLPTVTTQAATSIEATTATGNGNITDTGGENCDERGIVFDTTSYGDPGNVSPAASDYTRCSNSIDGFGTGAFTNPLTSLDEGTTYYARAYAHNSAGYSYGAEVSFLTKPAAPTNVAATDGDHTDKVVITWTKSTGATGYQVYRNGTPLGWLGDVATHNDTGAGAPTITPGNAVASDGASIAHVALSISGEGTSNGATHTYKVRARNATGESVDSGTNTGYRAPGSLTYQWQRSSGDSDANYGNIGGATTEAYNDTAAPAPTVTPGTASASDETQTAYVILSLAGESANNGAGRYYRCVLNAAGCTQQTTGVNRGYRGVGSLTRQWYRSAGDSDVSYSVLSGATTDPYNDTTAPAPTITPGAAAASDGLHATHVALSLSGQSTSVGAGRYYKCLVSATGAASQYSTANRGYRGVGSLTYQWQRSAADSDASYSNIDGATTASYNDTGAPENGDGRYYRCVENATGATQQISAVDRGYRITWPTVTTQAVSGIGTTTATGNGNITDTGGENCSKRGVCWNTTGSPTVADDKSEETDSFGTGAFTRPMTGLTPATKYYVKAYGYNSAGYGYGDEVSFYTLPPRHGFVSFQDPGIV